MRSAFGVIMMTATLVFGVAGCGSDDSTNATATTTAGLTGSAAIEQYCKLVTEAVAAAKSTDPSSINKIVPQLRASYQPAYEATKADPKLTVRFAECAKGSGAGPTTTVVAATAPPTTATK